ncbi:hypothetical protein Avbf_10709 [Armadillidium vulgare]|nr:hypothetical protein Avbf_10709 [Armadillidium vulgare]
MMLSSLDLRLLYPSVDYLMILKILKTTFNFLLYFIVTVYKFLSTLTPLAKFDSLWVQRMLSAYSFVPIFTHSHLALRAKQSRSVVISWRMGMRFLNI